MILRDKAPSDQHIGSLGARNQRARRDRHVTDPLNCRHAMDKSGWWHLRWAEACLLLCIFLDLCARYSDVRDKKLIPRLQIRQELNENESTLLGDIHMSLRESGRSTVG